MQPDSEMPPEIRKEILLTQCVEKGWDLFVDNVSRLGSTKGRYIQNEIDSAIPILKRYRSDWNEKLLLFAKKRMEGEPRLKSLTEAKIAVMTDNACYFRALKYLGEDQNAPNGYINTMEALGAQMPWNKTGSNPITLNQLTIEDLKEAVAYILHKLPTEK